MADHEANLMQEDPLPNITFLRIAMWQPRPMPKGWVPQAGDPTAADVRRWNHGQR